MYRLWLIDERIGLTALIEKAIPHWLKFSIETGYPSLLE